MSRRRDEPPVAPAKHPRERKPTADELRIWDMVTQQDKRLSHAAIDWPQEKAEPAIPASTTGAASGYPKATDEQLFGLLQQPFSAAGEAHAPVPTHGGLDRNSQRRLRQGKLAIEATLDLHGCGREEARHILTGFLRHAFEAQKRCVLVVTGKGRFHADTGRSNGVLREAVPQWLGQAPCVHWVLRHSPAQARHGGEGAVYILLRRKR